MDEDWDDPAPVSQNNFDGDTGRAFSRGRGFSSAIDNDPPGESWDDNPPFDTANGNDFGAGSGRFVDKSRGRGRGRGRGDGRGGGRGGRGGRGGFNGNFHDGGDGDGHNDYGDDRPSRGGFRGRGGRGGSRGGGGGYGDTGKDQEEKKREIYIPPDPTQDEDEMFHSGNTTGINFMKYDTIEVKTTGENIPPPIRTFEESNLRTLLLDNVKKSGYQKPTPIQKHAIPIIMNSRDLMGCAQTGSGKTAAFLLPIIHTLLTNQGDLPAPDGSSVEPCAVIVSPTRELCIQIYEQVLKFAHGSFLKVCILYGGTSVNYQKSRILNGCHILVATPGRLKDFVWKELVRFTSTRFVVLDEADRMLDMGFLPDVEELMSHFATSEAKEKNTLMFSATFPDEIQMLAGRFLNNYIFVAVGIVGGACSDVEQLFYQVEKFKKRSKLLDVLKEEGTKKTVIFVETKRTADFLATFLSENRQKTTSIHGDRPQREREEALTDFQRGTCDLLVATGVAARGLDIKDVKHVINFDMPKYIEEYVHRIGRTGRVGNRGKATSFFDDDKDLTLAGPLVKILKQAEQPIPDWLESAGRGRSAYKSTSFGGEDVRGDNFSEAWEAPQHPVDEQDEEW